MVSRKLSAPNRNATAYSSIATWHISRARGRVGPVLVAISTASSGAAITVIEVNCGVSTRPTKSVRNGGKIQLITVRR